MSIEGAKHMKNYTEIVNKAQTDVLAAVKQIQDASIASFQTMSENASGLIAGKSPASMIESMPSPTQVIENAYGFTTQILELQKGYALKVAEQMVSFAKAEKIDIAKKFEKSVN
jgi:hypothetical protein